MHVAYIECADFIFDTGHWLLELDLADIFINRFEGGWLRDRLYDFKSVFYLHCFLLTITQISSRKILSKHPNINFSIEKEKANLFQMLTFFVKTRHWELMPLAKRPSVGYTNFKSVITETYKIGLVWLLFRCFSLWLDFDKFYHEVHKLKNLLYENSKTATRVTRLTYILKNF